MRSFLSRTTLLGLGVVAACSGDSLAPTPGSLRLSLAFTGLDLDPDGALVAVDARAPVPVPAAGSVVVAVRPGPHTLTLSGLAANCTADGGGDLQVDVREGEEVEAAFGISCTAVTGVVLVAVSSQGPDPDPDGFLISLDGKPPQRVQSGSYTRFAPVAGGMHSVLVLDVASNCTVTGGNSLTLQVDVGGAVRDTVQLAVGVTCTPRTGSVFLRTVTSGTPDPDGYVLSLGSPPIWSSRLGANDSVVVSGVANGMQTLSVTDIAATCTLDGSVPGAVNVTGGDTVVVQVSVTCAVPAVLRVSAPTTGDDLDPAYLVRVDGGPGIPLPAGDTLTLDLVPGGHSVELTDVESNCTVGGANPAMVTLSTAAPTDLSFPVTCVLRPRTGVDITITTTGINPDDSYRLFLCGAADFYCYFPAADTVVAANGVLQLDLAPGSYALLLIDVAANCTFSTSGALIVTSGQVTPFQIQVTCYASADYKVSVSVTGSDPQTYVQLLVDRQAASSFAVPGTFTGTALEGAHLFELGYVQDNCQANSTSQTVTLISGLVTSINFTIDCLPRAVLTVDVTTTGTNIPAGYLVGVDYDFFYGYQFSSPITPNGSISLKLNSGSHYVWLDNVPGNCTVTAPNPVIVQGDPGTTPVASFQVNCQ